MSDEKSEAKRGPKPEILKAEGADWVDAVSHALHKPKPKGGWPDPKDCDHPRLSSEVMFGQKTGDYTCQVCGEVFTSEEAKAIRAKRR